MHSLPTLLACAILATAIACRAAPGLANLSTRAVAGTGAEVLTAGFVVGPGANKPFLIRAIGPTLAQHGLASPLADPELRLLDAAGAVIATNDDWQSQDAATMAGCGAFPLPPGSKDAALVVSLAPGNYTAQALPANGAATGLGLIEIYEVGPSDSRLLNLSARARVDTGLNLMISGLIIPPGASNRRLLIRAAGPALKGFQLSDTLVNPTLVVTDAEGRTLVANDDWGTPVGAAAASASLVATAAERAGAFPLAAGSRDAALIVELPPGSYGVQVRGAENTTGLAIVETYDITGIDLTSVADPAGIATAGNGETIPHPSSTKTYAVVDGARTISVPAAMAYVPGGSFTFGTGTTAGTRTIEGFCIGKFEVTNAEYKAFLDATGARSFPAHWSNGTYPEGKAAHPVLYVSLTSALAYCRWVSQLTGWNVSIPTAEQWEKAARGPGAYLFPWGNSLDATYSTATKTLVTRCNFNAVVAAYYLASFPDLVVIYNDSHSPYFGTTTTVSRIAAFDTSGTATYLSISSSGAVSAWVNHDTYTGFIYTDLFDRLNAVGGTTSPVGSYEDGRSAYGCYDMAGNVWEWTSTQITATNGAEAGLLVNDVRGGSWYATGNSCRAIGQGEGRSASGNYNTVGFRIVVTPPAP
jgi:formylglycine-generating enzyme required for sulfatase activity